MIFDIRIIFTIQEDGRRQKDKKRQNDKKTNKDRIIKKKEGQKEKRQKKDRKKKDKRRFILSTWHCYDRVPKVLLRFILIVQQVVARLTLIVMLAMKS